MLKADKLEISYGWTEALKGVSFKVSRGEIRSLLGPNGAGKTTAFDLLTGVERPRSGKIFLDEREITALPVNKRANLGLSYLLQKPSLFRQMSIRENITAVLGNKTKRKDFEESANSFLRKLDIGNLGNKKSGELSAGQRRKAEIARSLATSPTFLLLDEPFSGLDPLSVGDLKNIIINLKDEEELGIMVTDHKVRDTLDIADYNYLLEEGEIISEGSGKELLTDRKARTSYLGEDFNQDFH